MSPLQFEAAHAADWAELERLLDAAEGVVPTPTGKAQRAALKNEKKKKKARGKAAWDGARLAMLYRRSCEHLALAQSRAYPISITQRLEHATQRAHRLVYRRSAWGTAQLRQLVLVDFPQAVRAHSRYLLVATLVFLLPAAGIALAIQQDPGFILHLLDAEQVRSFDRMYGDTSQSLGRERPADTDWQMFGYYVMHNIGLGFQCFAGGLFAGLGSIFFLAFNGLMLGGVAAYLTSTGHANNFFSFVVTHAAFELTAIVLAGAAGLRLGHAWLAPGGLARLESVKLAARDSIVVVYGVVLMLLVAALLEAFWSSSRWVEPHVKYAVGAGCWLFVLVYLGLQGRPARLPPPPVQAHAG